MSVLLPTGKAANHTGIRRRLARTADRLQALDNASPHRMSRAEGGPMLAQGLRLTRTEGLLALPPIAPLPDAPQQGQ
jgi:hypothetical protein